MSLKERLIPSAEGTGNLATKKNERGEGSLVEKTCCLRLRLPQVPLPSAQVLKTSTTPEPNVALYVCLQRPRRRGVETSEVTDHPGWRAEERMDVRCS